MADLERLSLTRALKAIDQAEAMVTGLAIRAPASEPVAKALSEIKRPRGRLAKLAGLKGSARVDRQRKGGFEILEALHREALTPPPVSRLDRLLAAGDVEGHNKLFAELFAEDAAEDTPPAVPPKPPRPKLTINRVKRPNRPRARG